MDELGTALESIPDLRVTPYFASTINPPMAVVSWPTRYEYDTTFVRGADTLDFPISVFVGKVDVRTSRDLLSRYSNGSGAYSVKSVIEGYDYTMIHSVRVVSVEFGVITVAGVDFLAGTFRVNVIGRGV